MSLGKHAARLFPAGGNRSLRQQTTELKFGQRLGTALAPVVMLAAVTWVYRRIVAGRVLAGGDLQLYFFPYWIAVARSVRAGALPLWNPYLFTGVPLLANSQVGVFYPLNWPFWLLAKPSLDGIARAIHWSVIVHLWLAALNTYVLVRATWGHGGRGTYADSEDPLASVGPAVLAGIVYACGGFLGVHTEHLNQLQALAWLPLLFLPTMGVRTRRGLRRLGPGGSRLPKVELPHPLSIGALGMILLAGHTQMAFIAAVAVGAWHLCHVVAGLRLRVGAWPAALLTRGLPFALAPAPAAVQLLPALELAGLSGRSGGLEWREAVSFSVSPLMLPRALLPPYLVPPLFPEGVGYLGVAALLLMSVGVWHALSTRDRAGCAWTALAGLGLFLAVGGYNPVYLLAVRLGVPGLVHFRAPARFLALYVLGGAVLAGMGARWLVRWRPKGATLQASRSSSMVLSLALLVAVVLELDLSAVSLPHAHATTPRAYTDLRPATADLVAAARGAVEAGDLPGRFLSISQTLFEVGDKAEIEVAYGDDLSADALWAYIVASKQREVLAPNLSLAFGVPAADGYDGGILPLRSYMAFSELLLPGGTTDGRLRENLVDVPQARWLDLMGVQHLLTDKTTDAWIDGVLYDRQFQPALAAGQAIDVAWLPETFSATALALLHEGEGGVLTLHFAEGHLVDFELPASDTLAMPHYLRWEGAADLHGLRIRATEGVLRLGGAGLVDERTGAFYPIVISDAFRLVHSGDVKVYEDLTPPRRAFLVQQACAAPTLEAAVEVMADPSFDPARLVVLLDDGGGNLAPCSSSQGGEGGAARPGGGVPVSVVRYDDAAIVVDVVVDTPAYLVLSEAWYPGWTATVQSHQASVIEAVEVLQADLLFRAVPLSPGAWRVTLTYSSRLLPLGAAISLGALLLLAVLTCRRLASRL